MNHKLYWIWLQKILGYGAKTDEVISIFRNAKNVYDATTQERYFAGIFSKKQLEKMETLPLDYAREVMAECERLGCEVITPEDEEFPPTLLEMKEKPLALYLKGNKDLLGKRLRISIVGTRDATETGLTATYRVAKSLASAGVVVVSGGALGIDGASHLGALDAGGETIVVMGCGIDARYNNAAAYLKDRILEKGLFVSEFPPGTAPLQGYFPIRNRIVASICKGLIVAECAMKSGSMITVDYAFKFKKHLFAIPGNVLDVNNSGTTELIRNQCATPVFSAADVLRFFEQSEEKIDEDKIDYTALYAKTDNADFSKIIKYSSVRVPVIKKFVEEKPKTNDVRALNLDANAKTVYDLLLEGPMHIDELMKKSGSLSIGQMFSAITQLEINGLITSDSGKKYRRK